MVVHGTARLSQGQEASFIPNAEYPVGHDESQAMIARLNVVAPYKPRADVCVVGKAYAPPGTDIDRIVARVRVGDFSKALSITGDRLWIRDGARWGSSPPRPFSQMLLAPERAIRSAENPVGLDPAAIPMEGRLAMPNLEPVSGSYSAVIGPVPPNAPSRRNLLSGAAVGWVTTLEMGRAPGPPPEGMNFQFFNVAPVDQQLPELTPGSAIVLENLHPGHAIFTSRMPPLVPRVTGFDPATRRTLEIALRLDTLWIDGDREIAWVVYRGTVDVARPDLPVSLHVEAERWQRPVDAPPPSMGTATMLQTHTGAGAPAPLPFGGAKPSHGYGGWSGANTNPNEQTGGYYAQQSAGRTIQNETTSRLEETGSYPPPPPPKRSITQEIEIPAAPRPAGSVGLPFGGSADAPAAWDPETTTSTGLPRQDTTELHAPATADLPRQDTAVLGAIVDPPTRHRTEPPPPPNAASALPFGGQAPSRPSELSPESRTMSGAPPQAPPRRLVPRGSPGPIPDVGPTQEPPIDLAWIVDEVSEVTHTDDAAVAAPQAPLIVPRVAPAPIAPPPPAPIAPPPPAPIAPPPPAPVAPPPPVEPVAPPPVAPPPVDPVAPPPVAPPPVAPPPVAPPPVAPPPPLQPPALPKPPTAVPSAVSVLPAVPSAVSVPSAVAPPAAPPSAVSASDTEPPPPVAPSAVPPSAVAPSTVAPPPPALPSAASLPAVPSAVSAPPSAVTLPPAVPSAVSLPAVPSAVSAPPSAVMLPAVPSAVTAPPTVPSAVPPSAVAPAPADAPASARTAPPPPSAPANEPAVDVAPTVPPTAIAAQSSPPPAAAATSAAPSFEPVAPPLLSPIAPPKLATLIPPASKSVPPPSVRAAAPSAPPPAPAFADEDTPPAPERAEQGSADTAPPGPVAPTAPERSELGFEECARLRGELSIKGADKAAVLAKYNVSDAVFAKAEREHLMALDENARAGKSDLLERYDDAYLDAQDAARGPVDQLAYAKIQFARERGQLPQVLDELRVQRNDLMRLDRVWRRRLAADKDLAEKVEDELERLRTEG